MENEFIKVYEPALGFDDKGGQYIYMGIRIDTMSTMIRHPEIIMRGIADAMQTYVEKEKAPEIYAAIEKVLHAEIERVVKAEVEKRCVEILGKMDMQGLANIAAIGACKELGKKISE
jgi:hypothetical protein